MCLTSFLPHTNLLFYVFCIIKRYKHHSLLCCYFFLFRRSLFIALTFLSLSLTCGSINNNVTLTFYNCFLHSPVDLFLFFPGINYSGVKFAIIYIKNLIQKYANFFMEHHWKMIPIYVAIDMKNLTAGKRVKFQSSPI